MCQITKIKSAAVQTAIDEFVQLGRDKFLQKYSSFRPARTFFVLDPLSGVACDSKAIVGAAYGLQFPERGPLRAGDFSGGQATVVKLLSNLGFEVLALNESPWSDDENQFLINDYLGMLMKEFSGQKFNANERISNLSKLLNRKNRQSIENRRSHVSYLMIELGFPCLQNCPPVVPPANDSLIDVLIFEIENFPALDKAVALTVEMPAAAPESVVYDNIKTEVPKKRVSTASAMSTRVRRPMKKDYMASEARNRSLGLAGEEFVVAYEQWRLSEAGVGRLADQVKHVAKDLGDGLGYDILSFDTNGQERFIEVKTTAHDARTPFFITANELDFSKEQQSKFFLYRLYHFRSSPKFFELQGAIDQYFDLNPVTYRACF